MQTGATGAVRAAAALPEGAPALPPRISWGAVLAGGIAAAVIAATLAIFGAAIDATTMDASGRATPGASSLGIGAAVWLVVANTIALAAGGYTAARLSGTSDDTDGVLHGLAVWAIAFLVPAALLGNMVGGLASTAAFTAPSVVGGAAGGAEAMVSAAAGQTNPNTLMDRAVTTLRGTGGAPQQMTTEQRTAEISSLLARRAARSGFVGDERTRLDALVAAEAGVSLEEAGESRRSRRTHSAPRRKRRAKRAKRSTRRRAAPIGTFTALGGPSPRPTGSLQCAKHDREEGSPASTDDALVARMAPRLWAFHEQNRGDRAGTARSALALIREAHALASRGNAEPVHGGAGTPDAPREDD